MPYSSDAPAGSRPAHSSKPVDPKKAGPGADAVENSALLHRDFRCKERRKVEGTKTLRPEWREFLDRCVVPALVEKWFAERQEKERR